MRSERKARFAPPVAPLCEADPQGARGVSPPHPANGASDHAPQAGTPGVLAAGRTPVWFSCMLESMMTGSAQAGGVLGGLLITRGAHSNDPPGL